MLPAGCFFLAAVTSAWYVVYLFTAVAQVCRAVYAFRQSLTAVRMFATVWRTWVRPPVL